MATYQIAYKHAAPKVVLIQADNAALPVGYNDIGSFTHDDTEVSPPGLEHDVNHVVWHHVREALYHTSSKTGQLVPGALQFPDNITDMAGITLAWDAQSISAGDDFSLEVGESKAIYTAFTPEAARGPLTYASGTPATATVDTAGVVHAVAEGTSVITVTTANGKTDTVTVTVTAAA